MTMILNSSQSLDKSFDYHSKLLATIKKDVIDKSLLYLPKGNKDESTLLQMLLQFSTVNDEN